MGFFGFFGDAQNKPGTTASIVAIIGALGVIASLLVPLPDDTPRMQAVTACTGIVTTALAYLFGRGSRR
jgi:hypothetical protein